MICREGTARTAMLPIADEYETVVARLMRLPELQRSIESQAKPTKE
jgi:hypothetical protein